MAQVLNEIFQLERLKASSTANIRFWLAAVDFVTAFDLFLNPTGPRSRKKVNYNSSLESVSASKEFFFC